MSIVTLISAAVTAPTNTCVAHGLSSLLGGGYDGLFVEFEHVFPLKYMFVFFASLVVVFCFGFRRSLSLVVCTGRCLFVMGEKDPVVMLWQALFLTKDNSCVTANNNNNKSTVVVVVEPTAQVGSVLVPKHNTRSIQWADGKATFKKGQPLLVFVAEGATKEQQAMHSGIVACDRECPMKLGGKAQCGTVPVQRKTLQWSATTVQGTYIVNSFVSSNTSPQVSRNTAKSLLKAPRFGGSSVVPRSYCTMNAMMNEGYMARRASDPECQVLLDHGMSLAEELWGEGYSDCALPMRAGVETEYGASPQKEHQVLQWNATTQQRVYFPSACPSTNPVLAVARGEHTSILKLSRFSGPMAEHGHCDDENENKALNATMQAAFEVESLEESQTLFRYGAHQASELWARRYGCDEGENHQDDNQGDDDDIHYGNDASVSELAHEEEVESCGEDTVRETVEVVVRRSQRLAERRRCEEVAKDPDKCFVEDSKGRIVRRSRRLRVPLCCNA